MAYSVLVVSLFLLFLWCVVVAPKERISPSTCPRQCPVTKYHRTLEHIRFLAFRLEAIIGSGPDAFFLSDFAKSLTRSSTWAISLVLYTL